MTVVSAGCSFRSGGSLGASVSGVGCFGCGCSAALLGLWDAGVGPGSLRSGERSITGMYFRKNLRFRSVTRPEPSMQIVGPPRRCQFCPISWVEVLFGSGSSHSHR